MARKSKKTTKSATRKRSPRLPAASSSSEAPPQSILPEQSLPPQPEQTSLRDVSSPAQIGDEGSEPESITVLEKNDHNRSPADEETEPVETSQTERPTVDAAEPDAAQKITAIIEEGFSENRTALVEDELKTSPDLFSDGTTTRMASALPIWEASNILTQRQDLSWREDTQGKLQYSRPAGSDRGSVHFWVTENLEDELPATLAGAAALAVIDTFDIRAACMHLIYAAHAAQIDRPWEQEFVLDDRQIEAYLGLKKRTDKNKQQKLALIQEIAKQPCKITTFVSWPNQNGVKGFTLEEGRLWHLLGMRYHYQQDIFGSKELTGITFIVRAGLWARYFLNEEGRLSKSAFCEYATLSKSSLRDVMSVWQHREGAARLMVWLLFKARIDRQSALEVRDLMDVAFGERRIQQAEQDSHFRKKFVSMWDDTLITLDKRGWYIKFDEETYPPELRPMGLGRTERSRPRGFFNDLLSAQLWISPQEDWNESSLTVPNAVTLLRSEVEGTALEEPTPEVSPEPASSPEAEPPSDPAASAPIEPGLEFHSPFAPAQETHSAAPVIPCPPPVIKPIPPPVTEPSLTGDRVRAERTSRGWSQRKLATLTGLSQGLISQIENGGRSITVENEEILERIFTLNTDLKRSS